MLCDRLGNQLGDGLLHALMHRLALWIELCTRLRIPACCQHRLPLSCYIILEALDFVYGFLSVLSVCDDAVLLYHFLVDVDVGASGVHAGPWLC